MLPERGDMMEQKKKIISIVLVVTVFVAVTAISMRKGDENYENKNGMDSQSEAVSQSTLDSVNGDMEAEADETTGTDGTTETDEATETDETAETDTASGTDVTAGSSQGIEGGLTVSGEAVDASDATTTDPAAGEEIDVGNMFDDPEKEMTGKEEMPESEDTTENWGPLF